MLCALSTTEDYIRAKERGGEGAVWYWLIPYGEEMGEGWQLLSSPRSVSGRNTCDISGTRAARLPCNQISVIGLGSAQPLDSR